MRHETVRAGRWAVGCGCVDVSVGGRHHYLVHELWFLAGRRVQHRKQFWKFVAQGEWTIVSNAIHSKDSPSLNSEVRVAQRQQELVQRSTQRLWHCVPTHLQPYVDGLRLQIITAYAHPHLCQSISQGVDDRATHQSVRVL